MAVYTFINGNRKRIFSHKPVVYVNGVKHTIGRCYTFVNGVKKQIFDTWSLKHEELFLTNASVNLPFGTYQIVLRGAGGAGGETPPTTSGWNFISGKGGCGGKGQLSVENINLNNVSELNINVGIGGKTYTNGGNGGEYGNAGSNGAPRSGSGGGGGMPSWVGIGGALGGTSYYGWKHNKLNQGEYTGTTKHYYVTYTFGQPDDWKISETSLGFNVGSGFDLTNGAIYTDGQQIYSFNDSSRSVSITVSISGNTVKLVGTGSLNGSPVIITPLDITNNMVLDKDKFIYSQTENPSSGDTVYDQNLDSIGSISSVSGSTLVYNQLSYNRYNFIDIYGEYTGGSVYYALGGGGGGGGGGIATANRRYDNGGAGGGGGGYYILELSENVWHIISLGGKKGAPSTAYATAGVNGTSGDGSQDIYSGSGGNGSWANGGNNALGGGASGASGGGGPGNDNTGAGGSGAGGAGGCKDAGGGENAINTRYSQFNSSVVSYNSGKTIPTDTLAENASYGINSNYGIGGTTNTNGSQGFVLIKRVA